MNPRGRKLTWLIGGTALASLAGVLAVCLRPGARTFLTDADSIREPVASARTRDILWKPPAPLPAPILGEQDAYEPRLTTDGQTLFFVRGKPGENAEIFVALRTTTGWSEPRPLTEINTPDDELGPAPSADGSVLYFYSNRPGGSGGYDLWMARRGAAGWQEPANLGPDVNTEFNEYGPAPTPDGAALYFASNRPRPGETIEPTADDWPATLRERFAARPYDLFVAAIEDGQVKRAQAVTELNSTASDGAPCVSPSGDFIYYASNRPGGFGGFDLYRARRLRGAYQSPENLGPGVNSASNDMDPALWLDGFAMVFASDRPGESATPDSTQPYRLYSTTSREVFPETETELRTFPWAALINALWPQGFWALLTLALAMLLYRWLQVARRKRLSLLLRCLLVSLFAHLLVLMMMSFWRVTAAAVAVVRHRGPIRVALVSGTEEGRGGIGGRGEIYAQVRGELIHAPAAAAADVMLVRATAQPAEIASREVITTAEPSSARADRLEVAAAVSESRPVAPTDPRAPTPAPEGAAALALSTPALNTPAQVDESVGVAPAARAVETVRPTPTIGPMSSPPSLVEVAPTTSPSTSGSSAPASARLVNAATAGEARPTVGVSGAAALGMLTSFEPHPTEVKLAVPSAGEASTVSDPASSKEGAALAASASSAIARDRARLDLPVGSTGAPISVTIAPTSQVASGLVVTSGNNGLHEATPALPTAASTGSVLAGAGTLAPSIETMAKDIGLPAASGGRPGVQGAAESAAQESRSPIVAPVAAGAAPRAGPSLGFGASGGGGSTPAPAQITPSATSISLGSLVAATPMPDRAAAPVPRPNTATSLTSLDAVIASAPQLELGVPDPGDGAEVSGSGAPGDGADHPGEGGDDSTGRGPSSAPAREPRMTPVAPRERTGAIAGRVRDALTGRPLEGATIQLDLPDRPALLSTTDAEGRYRMEVPHVPDQFVITASRDQYVPVSVNIPAARLRRGTVGADFRLEPASRDVVSIESTPDVHHLGNDRFEGSINSQFQKQAEGVTFEARFDLSNEQLASAGGIVAMTMMAKGMQCPARIEVNGQRVRWNFDESPQDGSFGPVVFGVDAAVLRAGDNTITVTTTACRGDLDDFEFVNLQVRLARPTEPQAR